MSKISNFVELIQDITEIDPFPLAPPEGANIKSVTVQDKNIEVVLSILNEEWCVSINDYLAYTVSSDQIFNAQYYTEHPVINLFEVEHYDLSFNCPKNSGCEKAFIILKVIEEHLGKLDSQILDALGINNIDNLVNLLDGGYGILLHAPKCILDLITEELTPIGFKFNFTPRFNSEKSIGNQMLTIGSSWFVANRFDVKPNKRINSDK